MDQNLKKTPLSKVSKSYFFGGAPYIVGKPMLIKSYYKSSIWIFFNYLFQAYGPCKS